MIIFINKLFHTFEVVYGILVGMMPTLHGRKLNETEKKQIREQGLVHYTEKDNADSILKDKLIKPSTGVKAYSNSFCMPCTYFFINGEDSKKNIDLNVTNNKNCGVYITDLAEEQISNCKRRSFDSAIVYDGEFRITNNNKVESMALEIRNKPRKLFSVKDCVFAFFYLCPLILIFL